MRVFIGCSSKDEINEEYYKIADDVCDVLIDNNSSLVFGATREGLMGKVYDRFKSANKEVLAICTEHYSSYASGIECKLVMTPSTLEQLELFMKNSDIMLFLPGGYGTLCEMLYMMAEYVNETHNNRIVIINFNHFYDNIKEMLFKVYKEKFSFVYNFITFIESKEELSSYMEDIC